MADLAEGFKRVVSFQEDMADKQASIDQKLRIISDQTAVEKRALTPSAACLSENAADFTRLFSLLRLAEGPKLSTVVNLFQQGDLQHNLPKFSFKWKDATFGKDEGPCDMDDVVVMEKILERSSYVPLVNYLLSQSLYALDVSDGQGCQEKNLFDSDIFTIRPNIVLDTVTLRKTSQCPFLIQKVRGRTDVVVIDARYVGAAYVTKFQVRVAIEVKTIKQMNHLDACLREAAVQLVGLNTENIERSPPVLLTNFAGRHFVLYLSLGPSPEVRLEYKLHIDRFDTFEHALAFSLLRGDLPPITSNFGRRATPPPSVGSEGGGDEDT